MSTWVVRPASPVTISGSLPTSEVVGSGAVLADDNPTTYGRVGVQLSGGLTQDVLTAPMGNIPAPSYVTDTLTNILVNVTAMQDTVPNGSGVPSIAVNVSTALYGPSILGAWDGTSNPEFEFDTPTALAYDFYAFLEPFYGPDTLTVLRTIGAQFAESDMVIQFACAEWDTVAATETSSTLYDVIVTLVYGAAVGGWSVGSIAAVPGRTTPA